MRKEMRYLADNNKINISDEESSTGGSNLMHENYLKLKSIAEGMLTNRYSYMKLRAPGFMDLVVERIWSNRISLSHYYEQNGDLMADPDMELIVDHKNEILRAATFQQDNLGIYQIAINGACIIDGCLADELNCFLNQWLSNIALQGHIPYKAYYDDDVMGDCYEVRFDTKGNEIKPDYIEEEDLEL